MRDNINYSKVSKSSIKLVLIDDSNDIKFLSKNREVLYDIFLGFCDSYHVSICFNRLSPIRFIYEQLGTDCASIFSRKKITKKDIDSEFNPKLGGFDSALQVQQLFALGLIKSLAFRAENTVVSFYEDDIIFNTLTMNGNRVIEKDYDFLSNRESAVKKGYLLYTGKYLHNHGNPWVQLLRDVVGVQIILQNNFVLTQNDDRHSILFYKNNRYIYLKNRAALKELPNVINSIQSRASIINPFIEEDFKYLDKSRINFDEGNFGLRGDLIIDLPINQLGGFQSVFHKIILSIKYSDFVDKIYTEPGVVHRKIVKEDAGTYLSTITLGMLINSETSILRSHVNDIVCDNLAVYRKKILKVLGVEISFEELQNLFSVPDQGSKFRNLGSITTTLECISSLRERYKRVISDELMNAIERLLEINDIDSYVDNGTYTINETRKRIDKYFNSFECWKSICDLKWSKYIDSTLIHNKRGILSRTKNRF